MKFMSVKRAGGVPKGTHGRLLKLSGYPINRNPYSAWGRKGLIKMSNDSERCQRIAEGANGVRGIHQAFTRGSLSMWLPTKLC